MNSPIDDQEILRLCLSEKDRDKGYRLLLSQYQQRIYFHIRRIVISHDDANDITQDVFIKVWNGLPNFRGDSKIYSWIYRIATNETLNYIRKHKKRKFLSSESTEEYLTNKLVSETLFEGDAIELNLQKAIIKLPEQQRLVFNMRYYDDLTYREISEILNLTEGGLKASYHHAVKKVKDMLELD